MRRVRPDEQHQLENALGFMSTASGELRILHAQALYSRKLSRYAIATCAARAARANDMARASLSKVWNGMEIEFKGGNA